LLAVLLFAPLPANNLWWREAVNSGHTLLFFFLSFAIYYQLSAKSRLSNHLVIYLLVLLIAMLMGVLVEALQIASQRDASLNDIYRNFLGIMAAVCLLVLFNTKKLPYRKLGSAVLIIVAATFLWFGLNPLFHLSWHYFERHNAFPVIIEFDAGWSTSFVRYSNARMVKTLDAGQQRNRLHTVRFYPGNYPGVSIIEPEPDWSDYGYLSLIVHSMSASPHYMVLRVHDENHNQQYTDRFNKRLVIQPGVNKFSISLDQIRFAAVDRELDLKNIAGLVLFSGRLKQPLQIAVSNITLIK